MTKKYSIVRVDNKCLSDYENIKCPYDYKCAKCKFGKLKNYNYGDTKEQFIKKVAQILFKEKIKHFIELFGKSSLNKKWKQIYSKEAYEQAEIIVEFLGVK